MYGWFSLPAKGYGGLHYIIPQAAAGCQAIRHIQFCAFRFSPASWWVVIRRSAPLVGRFSDPADRVTKPPRLVHWNHIPIFVARFQQLLWKRSHSTNQSKNRNRVGGVKTPPYGIANQITIPQLAGFSRSAHSVSRFSVFASLLVDWNQTVCTARRAVF